MTVKVFVNFDDKVVVTEKEYQERLNEAINNEINDDTAFNEWLADNYCVGDIWYASLAEREKILDEWKENCQEYVLNDSDEAWTEFRFEI